MLFLTGRKRDKGNVGDLLGSGLCILAMMTVMMGCFQQTNILQKKVGVAQIARKYMLRMETVGYLEADKKRSLLLELENQGMSMLSLEGTTQQPVDYGETIVLRIKGTLDEKYEILETKTSTAKN